MDKLKVTINANGESKESSFTVNKVSIDKDSVFPNTIVELSNDSDTNNIMEFEFEKEEYKLLGSRIIDVVSESAKNDVDMRLRGDLCFLSPLC